MTTIKKIINLEINDDKEIKDIIIREENDYLKVIFPPTKEYKNDNNCPYKKTKIWKIEISYSFKLIKYSIEWVDNSDNISLGYYPEPDGYYLKLELEEI